MSTPDKDCEETHLYDVLPHCGVAKTTNWGTDDCEWKTKYPDGARILHVHVGKTGGTSVANALTIAWKDHDQFAQKPRGFNSVHTWAWRPHYGLSYPNWDLLVISVREPTHRTGSAYNFLLRNKERVAENDYHKAMDACFPAPTEEDAVGEAPYSFDAFAKSLNETNQTDCAKLARLSLSLTPEAAKHFGHMAQDVEWYMNASHYPHADVKSLMQRLEDGEVRAFLTRTESLKEDIQSSLEWLCVPKDKAEMVMKEAETDEEFEDVLDDTGEIRKDDTFLSDMGNATLREALKGEYSVIERLEELADNGVLNKNNIRFKKHKKDADDDEVQARRMRRLRRNRRSLKSELEKN